MVNSLTSNIFDSFVISRNFKVTIGQNEFVEFFGVFKITAEFGWPERLASFVSAWPRLKAESHLLTVVSAGTESE